MTDAQLTRGDVLVALSSLQEQIAELMEVIEKNEIDPSLESNAGANVHCGRGSQD